MTARSDRALTSGYTLAVRGKAAPARRRTASPVVVTPKYLGELKEGH
jgi:hypothetical protein